MAGGEGIFSNAVQYILQLADTKHPGGPVLFIPAQCRNKNE